MISLLLFDLDGTLADSRRDLALAVNRALATFGAAALHDAVILPFIGFGAAHLVRESLRAAGREDVGLADAMPVFTRLYREHLLVHTALYPGVAETLPLLRGIPKVVITNKPNDLSEAVLEGLGIRSQFALVLGGDALAEMKPSALPLRHAMETFGVGPRETMMIGDLPVDLEAARAAGTWSCAALYGFMDAATLRAAAPDYSMTEFRELPGILAGIS
jgi:phosphoglycolate phosphatase